MRMSSLQCPCFLQMDKRRSGKSWWGVNDTVGGNGIILKGKWIRGINKCYVGYFHIQSSLSLTSFTKVIQTNLSNAQNSSYHCFFFFSSSRYFPASLMKLQIIMIIMMPIGNADIMLTDWIFLIELSEKTSAIGRAISNRHQSNVIKVCGRSSPSNFL